MITEERPGLYRIEVPLPGSPLKQTNAYAVRGADRHLLIDNGFRQPEGEHALREALAALHLPLEKLDFFLTHLHSDHCGLTAALCQPASRIFCSATDGEAINAAIVHDDHWRHVVHNLGKHGFPPAVLDEIYATHPGKVYASATAFALTPVDAGHVFCYGDYNLQAMSTPGHTPGHMVLYETKQHFLLSGDHILGSITPNIAAWDNVKDSLGNYLHSLASMLRMPMNTIYPGHRAVITKPQQRIHQLLAHHEQRLDETLAILRHHPKMQAYDVARRMQWSLHGQWQEYRPQQQCFAVGEAASHLDHLAVRGGVQRHEAEGTIFYSIAH